MDVIRYSEEGGERGRRSIQDKYVFKGNKAVINLNGNIAEWEVTIISESFWNLDMDISFRLKKRFWLGSSYLEFDSLCSFYRDVYKYIKCGWTVIYSFCMESSQESVTNKRGAAWCVFLFGLQRTVCRRFCENFHHHCLVQIPHFFNGFCNAATIFTVVEPAVRFAVAEVATFLENITVKGNVQVPSVYAEMLICWELGEKALLCAGMFDSTKFHILFEDGSKSFSTKHCIT